MMKMALRKLHIISVCLAAIFAFSCSSENIDEGEGKYPDGLTTLTIPLTRGSAAEENNITKARVIIFTVKGGEATFYSNEVLSAPAGVYTKLVPVGELNVYLIANELSSWNLSAIGTSSSPATLKSKIMTFAAYPVINWTNPAPMYGEYEGVRIAQDGSTTLNGYAIDLKDTEGTVHRLYSKVSLSINCLFSDLPSSSPITLESVSIKQMPKKSYLSSARYTESGTSAFFDGAAVAAVSGTNYFPTGTGFTGDFEFYIPEYVVSDATKGTYISVVAHLSSRPSTKLKYNIMLGDSMDKGIAYMTRTGVTREDLTISRNTHYKVAISRIKGFGEVDGMDIYAKAEPWEVIEVDNSVKGRQLNVSHVVIEASELGKRKLHFWSNQQNVTLEPTAELKVTTYTTMGGPTSVQNKGTVNIEDYFYKIAGSDKSNIHFTWNSSAKTGAGYILLAPKSASTGTYEFKMWLNANGLRRQVTVTVIMPFHWDDYPYVGAFWKKNETGERLIYAGHNANLDWQAYINSDPYGMVTLAEGSSNDPYIKSTTPGDAENYQLPSGVIAIQGTGNIAFRIGLTSTTTVNRYAIVSVVAKDKSGGTTYVSDIYIRQGESADRVLSSSSTKWLPYNMNRTNEFTEYPSQAGRFYKWGSVHVHNPVDPIGTEWSTATMLEPDFNSVCPAGYKYPASSNNSSNNGDFSYFTDYYSQWGYYADGFFDRREDFNTGAVNASRNDVAYAGCLVYDNIDHRSVFFPAASSRLNETFDAGNAGKYGYYWTDAAVNSGTSSYQPKYYTVNRSAGYVVTFQPGWAPQADRAMPVRCVAQ